MKSVDLLHQSHLFFLELAHLLLLHLFLLSDLNYGLGLLCEYIGEFILPELLIPLLSHIGVLLDLILTLALLTQEIFFHCPDPATMLHRNILHLPSIV